MANDLEYGVSVSGVDQLKNLETAIKAVNTQLSKPIDTKNISKLATVLQSLQGTRGASDTVAAEIAKLQLATKDLGNTFRGVGDSIASTLKTELAKTAGSIRNDVTALGDKAMAGFGEAAAKSTERETAKFKNAAAKARAEMTAAYNKLVGVDGGLKNLNTEDLAIVKGLQAQGAAISKHHAELIRNLEASSAQTLSVRNKLAAAEAKAIAENNAQIIAAEAQAAKAWSNLRKQSVAEITAPNGGAMKAKSSMLAEMLREEDRQAKQAFAEYQATAAMVRKGRLEAMTAQNGAGAAGKSVFADMLRQEEAAARQTAVAWEALRSAKVKALTLEGRGGTVKASGTAFADMLRAEEAASKVSNVLPIVGQTKAAAAALKELEAQSGLAGKATYTLDKGFKQLTVSGGDLHGMVRGLTSGFGALWMSWGNVVPLLAGAAISHGFMETAKQGMAVAHSLEVISALGIGTSDSVAGAAAQMKVLNTELIELGKNGPFGPKEVAEAMKTLSLAGLEASKIASVLPSVLNFSLAGDTSITEAADVLVSVTTAFGTGAAGFERSSDIIMRAAADSKASVESFGSAMKTASVVGEQFNASQEDVAVMIQYLANLGIQGTAAGTAIRNMYADLSGRSGQTSKIIKQLGLDFRDAATGGIKPVTEVAKELYTVLQNYDAISQKNIMQAIFSERGGKAIIEVMAQYAKQVDTVAGKTNQLALDIEKFNNAAGQSAIAAAKMAETTQNAWKSAGSALRTTMYEAFEELQPALYNTANALKAAFNSPELKAALISIGNGITTVTQYVAENATAIAKAAEYYVMYRVGLLALNAVYAGGQAAAAAYTAVKQRMALASANAATAAAAEAAGIRAVATAQAQSALAGGASLGILGKTLKVLPIVGNAIALGGVAWSIYDMFAGKAAKTSEDYADNKAQKIADALNKESEEIEQINMLRAAGLTLLEAEARLKLKNAQAAVDADSIVSRTKLRNDADVARSKLWDKDAQIKKDSAEFERIGQGGSTRARESLAASRLEMQGFQADLDSANASLKKLDETNNKAMRELEAATARRAAAGKGKEYADSEDAKRAAAASAASMKAVTDSLKGKGGGSGKGAGTEQWSIDGFQKGQKDFGKDGGQGDFERAQIMRDHELKAIETHWNSRAEVTKAGYEKESRFLDMRREGEIISEAEYAQQSYALAEQYENDRIALAEAKASEYMTAYQKRTAAMRDAMEKAENPQTKDVYAQQLAKEQNDAIAFAEKTTAEVEKIKIESNARIEQSFIKLESTAYKLMKTDKDFWEKRKRDTARSDEVKDLERAYENMNTSIFSAEQAEYARAKAMMEVKHATEEHINDLKKQVDVQVAILEGLQAELALRMQMDSKGDTGQLQALQDGVNRTQEVIDKLKGRMSDAIANGAAEGAEAGSKAFAEQMHKQSKEFQGVLTDSIVTSLMEGGSAGGKKLRDYLQQELLRKPLIVLINGFLNGIFGDVGGGIISSVLGGSGGGGSNASSLINAGKTGYDLYSGNGLVGNAYKYAANYFGWGGTPWTAAGTQASGAVTMPVSGSVGGAAPGSGGWLSSVNWGAIAGFALPLVAAYLGGMFKEEKMVGQGLTGDLGGDLYGYQLMRESGGLFDGPDYRYVVAEKVIKDTKAEIEALKADTSYDTDPRYKGNGAALRDKKIQDLYRKLEYYERDYAGAIEGSKGPIKIIQSAFTAMRENTANKADSIGLNGDSIRTMKVALGVDEIHPDTGGKGLQLTGLTQEEASAKIQQALEAANEEMARSVLGSWKDVTREVTTIVWDTVAVAGDGDTETYTRVAREVKENVTEQVWEMSKYVREGETAVQALDRLSGSLVAVNAWLTIANKTLYETSLAGADMASQLVDAFGGMEQFTEATKTYYDAFYSDSEKIAAQTKAMSAQFEKAGMVMPATREAFRALVEAQDLTTEKGRKNYAMLLQLAGAMDGLYDAAEAAADALHQLMEGLQNDLLQVQGRYKEAVTAQHNKKLEELRKTGGQKAVDLQLWIWYYEAQNYLRKQEIDILRAQGKELEAVALEREMELKQIEVYGDQAVANAKKLWALQDAAKAQAEAEKALEDTRKKLYDNLAAAIEREKTAVTKVRDETQALISDMQGVVDAARNAARELYNTIDRTAEKQTTEARETINEILATLKSGGKAPTQKVLSEAITQSRVGLSSENFLTEYEYQRQTLVLAGKLAEISDLTDGSLSIEEQALEALNAQLAQFDTTLEYYEKQLGLAQDGIDASLSVGQAVAQIEAFLRNQAAEDKATKAAEEAKKADEASKKATADAKQPAATKPWTSGIYDTGTGGAKVGGIVSGAPRTYVTGYDKDGRAHYSDGSVGQAKAGEYIYNSTGSVTAAGLTADQWARLQAGQEPFPGSWVGGVYQSNGTYKWDEGQQMYIPSFDVGINRVPHDMLAYIHKDEAVVPAKYNEYNPNAATGSTDSKLLVEVRDLLYSIAGSSALTVEIQQKSLDILDDVTEGGNAMRNEIMNPEDIKLN